MTQEQKVIRAKVGMLELAWQLGNVSKACRVWVLGCRLVSCPPPAFDVELHQFHDVREELGRYLARRSGLNSSPKGFVKQGQGHMSVVSEVRSSLQKRIT
ncbi:hypothetical protein B0G80_1323 [Paraburkholderia sp. BL6669N2]|uniref:hypothetical protein n=1 Tax=Paraburkholderia sp. BL6669N2 TaxID=1938807 RepID=UPI000E232DE2|nr:hypothetical protein [Paraburkholderia sp. BL6669N2]REG58658.1 hypothetical protein B0G80_1323 [Paraburkholderia sp. BL6669N2]